MGRTLVVLALLAIASPAAAERTCVAIKKGKKLYATRGKTVVGKTTAKVAVEVEARRGAWLKVSRELLDHRGGDDVYRAGGVELWVRRRDTTAGECPASSNISEIGIVGTGTSLRWRDGARAGHVDHAPPEYRCATATRTFDGDTYRCFPWTPVEGLAVTVCALPGRDPRTGTGGGPSLGDPPPCP